MPSLSEPSPSSANRHLDAIFTPGGGFWIFAYGSLMWNPGFPPHRSHPALLDSYHRRFAIYSSRFRGTVDQPGLVLGLCPGGSCYGLALHISAEIAAQTLIDLRAREQFLNVYIEKALPLRLLDTSETIHALCFIADPNHPSFADGLSLEEQCRLICTARGERGPNTDYLTHTHHQLVALGFHDPLIEQLWTLVSSTAETSAEPHTSRHS